MKTKTVIRYAIQADPVNPLNYKFRKDRLKVSNLLKGRGFLNHTYDRYENLENALLFESVQEAAEHMTSKEKMVRVYVKEIRSLDKLWELW